MFLVSALIMYAAETYYPYYDVISHTYLCIPYEKSPSGTLPRPKLREVRARTSKEKKRARSLRAEVPESVRVQVRDIGNVTDVSGVGIMKKCAD